MPDFQQPAPGGSCPACREGGIEQTHTDYPDARLGDDHHGQYIPAIPGAVYESLLLAPAPPGVVELGETAAAWLDAIVQIDSQMEALKAARARAAEHVQAAMGDAVEARIGGRPVVSWKPSKPGTSLDRKGLEKHLGSEVFAQFVVVNKAARPFKVLSLDGE